MASPAPLPRLLIYSAFAAQQGPDCSVAQVDSASLNSAAKAFMDGLPEGLHKSFLEGFPGVSPRAAVDQTSFFAPAFISNPMPSNRNIMERPHQSV